MTSEKINEKTPSGGDYSIIYYFSSNMTPIDKEKATKAIIRECKENGDLVQENYIDII